MQQNKTRRRSRDGILRQGRKRRGEKITESHVKDFIFMTIFSLLFFFHNQALLFWLALFWCHTLGVLLRAECVQGIPVWRGEDERKHWRGWLASLGGRGGMATSECHCQTLYFHRAYNSQTFMQILVVTFSQYFDKIWGAYTTSSPRFRTRVIAKS